MTYEQHLLSKAFPTMDAADLQALTDDIKVHGQRSPIILYDGKVLDGWHRYQACTALQLQVDEVQLAADEDPAAYVLSRNLHRRHMDGSQRAAAVAACSAWSPVGKPRKCAPGAHLETASELAQKADVSLRTIMHAKAAHDAGLGDAVTSGRVSAKCAANIAKLPQAERAAALAEAVNKRNSKKRPAKKRSGRTSPAKKTPKQEAAEPLEAGQLADAHGDFDPLRELETANRRNEMLQAQVDVAETDDAKAELLKLHRMHGLAERRQSELMMDVARARDNEQSLTRELTRCGKAVGEKDLDRIAPAVEAYVRQHTKVVT